MPKYIGYSVAKKIYYTEGAWAIHDSPISHKIMSTQSMRYHVGANFLKKIMVQNGHSNL